VNVPRDVATYTTGAGIDNPIVRLSTDRNNITFLSLYEGATIREEEKKKKKKKKKRRLYEYRATNQKNILHNFEKRPLEVLLRPAPNRRTKNIQRQGQEQNSPLNTSKLIKHLINALLSHPRISNLSKTKSNHILRRVN
jgi:hypothetical protein